MKKKFVCVALLFTITLCGCSKQAGDVDSQTNSPSNVPVQIEIPDDENKAPESEHYVTLDAEATKPVEKEIIPPAKDEVYAAREQALEGMTEEQIDRLYTVIIGANNWWEREYLWHNIFSYLEDPNDLMWNYFHQTGEIQVGWDYTGEDYSVEDIQAIKEKEGLSWNGFCEKYGTDDTLCKYLVINEYNADDFIGIIESITETVQSDVLQNDLRSVIDKVETARDTHDMYTANDLYKILHDLDYFLLRYGPEDAGKEMTNRSLVAKYFGMLSFYA